MSKKGKVLIRRYKGDRLISERHTDYPAPTWPLTITKPHARMNRARFIIREVYGWALGIALAFGATVALYYYGQAYQFTLSWLSNTLDRLMSWAGAFLGV